MLSFTVYGTPAPSGSKTPFRGKSGAIFVRDASPRSYPWKRDVAKEAALAMRGGHLLAGPLRLEVAFYVPRPKGHFGKKGLRAIAPAFPTVKPDATKLLRAVEDSMNGVVWRDDSQVVEQYVTKQYGEPARAEVSVRAITERI